MNLSTPECVKAYLVSSIHRKLIRQVTKMRTAIHEVSMLEFVHSKEGQIIFLNSGRRNKHKINKAFAFTAGILTKSDPSHPTCRVGMDRFL